MASNLRNVITWNQAVEQFNEHILPQVQEEFEQDGIKDIPARSEAWNNWTDSLCKDEVISDWQYENWSHAPTCEGCQMKDKQNRWPEPGDLLIHTDGAAFNSGEKCQGLIIEVVGGKDFGGRVFVKWADDNAPYDYGDKYGYSAVNIHNDFGEFDVVQA